jgi:hypothetical protein
MHMMAWSSNALAAVASNAPSANAIFMAQQSSLPQSFVWDLKRRDGTRLGLRKLAEQGGCIRYCSSWYAIISC